MKSIGVPVSACFAVVLGTAAIATGCGSASAESRRVVPADDPRLTCGASSDPTTGTWESAPWGPVDADACPWLEYPGSGTLEIEHGLGRKPRTVLVYVSFQPTGTGASIAPGDMATVVEVTDRRVSIRNRTNQKLYARIVLQ